MNNVFTQTKLSNHDAHSTPFFRFSFQHGVISWLLLCVLVVIALYARDSFIRPVLGDVLVVMWLYYLLASVVNRPYKQLIFASISVAFIVEACQYFQLTKLLNIEPFSVLHIILGATFDWMDLVAYTIGAVLCLFVEVFKGKILPIQGERHNESQ